MNNIDPTLQEAIDATDQPKEESRFKVQKHVSEDTIKVLARRLEESLPTISLSKEEMKSSDECFEESALLAIVKDAESNKAVTQAQIKHARKKRLYESWRKTLTEPLLQAKRKIDELCNGLSDKHEKEATRLGLLNSNFELAERKRVFEEQEIQRKRLEEIERQRQAEIERVATEQRAKEREAIEARIKAERETAAAKSEAERISAKMARDHSDRLAAIVNQSASLANAAVESIQTKAGEAARIESKPIESTRSAGQVFADDWDFQVTLPYEAIKHYPDCFLPPKILVGALKARIKAGLEFDKNFTMKGITFTRKLKANVRTGKGVIDV